MKPDRRDFVKFGGGLAAGVFLSPLPWKLLDDTAIWTQNWKSIPIPPRGPVEARGTVCTLCPSACGVKAMTVGGVPVRLSGALCPAGLAAHHLAYHPFRLTGPAIRGQASTMEKVQGELTRAIAQSRKPVAVLDARPGRTASRIYRQALASWSNGLYVTPAPDPLAVVFGADVAIDTERASTVVGFGAPLFEQSAGLARRRDQGLRVLQVDARHSRSASLADRWISVRPGCESAVALALACELKDSSTMPPELGTFLQSLNAKELAADAGIAASAMDDLALAFTGGKAYAAGGVAAALLNAVASRGLVVERRPVPDTAADVQNVQLPDVPEGGLGVLFVDATVLDQDVHPAWLRNLMDPDGVLVVLSAHSTALTAAADYAIPAPAFLEAWDDVATRQGSPVATYSVASPLLSGAAASPADFVAQLAGQSTQLAKEMEARAAMIHASARGRIQGKPVSELDAKAFWTALTSGETWLDDPMAKTAVLQPRLTPDVKAAAVPEWEPRGELPLALLPFRTLETAVGHAQSPLLTKIYQESELRPGSQVVLLHPQTAAARGLVDGEEATLRTSQGTCRVRVRLDVLVRRDAAEAPLSPSAAEIAGTARPGVPEILEIAGDARVVAAQIERA